MPVFSGSHSQLNYLRLFGNQIKDVTTIDFALQDPQDCTLEVYNNPLEKIPNLLELNTDDLGCSNLIVKAYGTQTLLCENLCWLKEERYVNSSKL